MLFSTLLMIIGIPMFFIGVTYQIKNDTQIHPLTLWGLCIVWFATGLVWTDWVL